MEAIYEVALRLARHHAEIEPSIQRIYLFPSEEEIRLVEVDEDVPATHGAVMEPWYFNSDPPRIDFPSGVALIRPDEDRIIQPPEGWGNWDVSELIWERVLENA
jgi:hypothetical protein